MTLGWAADHIRVMQMRLLCHLQMLELALARSLDGAHRVVQGSRPGSASAASFGRPAKQACHPLCFLQPLR